MTAFVLPPPDDAVEASQLLAVLDAVGGAIERVQYLRLKKELLEGTNPEINTDKTALISRMEQLGFRPEIAAALEEVDRQVLAAGRPLDFKMCMDSRELPSRKWSKTQGGKLPQRPQGHYQPLRRRIFNRGSSFSSMLTY